MLFLLQFIVWLLNLVEFFLLVYVIMSWLIGFGVINVYNNVVRMIWDGLSALMEPLLRPFQRLLPAMGGLDISPLLLVVVIELIKQVIVPNLAQALL